MSTPYGGNAANFPGAVTIPVDGVDNPTFSNIESPVEANRDSLMYLSAGHAQDWRPAWLGTAMMGASNAVLAAAWDPLLSQWIFGGTSSSGAVDNIWSTLGSDDGSSTYFTNAGSAGRNVYAMAVCADPTTVGRYWSAIQVTNTDFYTQYTNYTGGGYTLGFHASGNVGLNRVDMITFNGYIIVFIGATSGGGSNFYAYAQASAPTTWTTGTSGGAPPTSWALATDNASIVLAVPRNTNAYSTGTTAYLTSTNGHTFSATSLQTTLLLNATDTVQGLCWSPSRGAFFAWVNIGASNTPQLFKSTNGTTWTAVTMVTTSVVGNVSDMSAIGPNLVAILDDSGGTVGSRTIFSPDGGATWYRGAASFASNNTSSASTYIHPRIAQGDNGLFAINSLWGRFSHRQGLPSVRL